MGQANKKSKLSQAPSSEEASISDEMKQGRKPKNSKADNPGQRNLQTTGKKILVHGYCSVDPNFPDSHFTNEIRFYDPDTTNPTKSSWSHLTFAKKINKFAKNQGISSCGCVAALLTRKEGLHALHCTDIVGVALIMDPATV